MSTNKESFLRCVTGHEMSVLSDDGVNRHLRFKHPETNNQYFDLITWPGHLCFTGDMGTYVFSRLNDMFTFFRSDDKKREPNFDYWHEKLLSVDRHGGDKRYSKEFAEEAINLHFEDITEALSDDDKQLAWEEVESAILPALDEGSEVLYNAIHNFNSDLISFDDFYPDVDDYTHAYRWCCYAVQWGIRQYDLANEAGIENDQPSDTLPAPGP